MSAWENSNQNESLNGTIWSRVPQEVFVGRDILEFGLYDAISHFNMGSEAVLLLYEALQIACGYYTQRECQVLDSELGHNTKSKMSARREERC